MALKHMFSKKEYVGWNEFLLLQTIKERWEQMTNKHVHGGF